MVSSGELAPPPASPASWGSGAQAVKSKQQGQHRRGRCITGLGNIWGRMGRCGEIGKVSLSDEFANPGLSVLVIDSMIDFLFLAL